MTGKKQTGRTSAFLSLFVQPLHALGKEGVVDANEAASAEGVHSVTE